MQDPSPPPPFAAVAPPLPPPFPEQEKLRCPRCDSTNTKFCYYNNYNLSQPRHFCKSCRRYWTKGGSLRNIPVGGGSRKNSKRSSAAKRAAGATEKPEPEPISGLGSHGLGFSPPMGGFASMLMAGDGNGLSGGGGVVESGVESRMGCWGGGSGGGSNIGWTDLAIFTPTSRFDSSESTCSQISYKPIV